MDEHVYLYSIFPILFLTQADQQKPSERKMKLHTVHNTNRIEAQKTKCMENENAQVQYVKRSKNGKAIILYFNEVAF